MRAVCWLCLVTLVACRAASGSGAPPAADLPPKPEGALRVLTLNVAHGRALAFNQAFLKGPTIVANLDAVAAVLERQAPDVVGLQEADGSSTWSGGFDHVAYLARAAGLPATHRGDHAGKDLGGARIDYGTALLGREGLRTPASHAFDTSWRDTKGFVIATVPVAAFGGVEVDVASVHLDFLSPGARRRQLEQLADALSQRRRPLVVLGDFNCGWDSCLRDFATPLGLSSPRAGASTFPADSPSRRLDWILISEELAFAAHHVLPVTVSDHRPVVADLVLRAAGPR